MTKGLKKKSTITALLANTSHKSPFIATYFRVGDRALATDGNEVMTMPRIKKISFARHAWGQGASVDTPCYCVAFVDSEEIVIIPESKVEQIMLTSDRVEDDDTPGLPD